MSHHDAVFWTAVGKCLAGRELIQDKIDVFQDWMLPIGKADVLEGDFVRKAGKRGRIGWRLDLSFSINHFKNPLGRGDATLNTAHRSGDFFGRIEYLGENDNVGDKVRSTQV